MTAFTASLPSNYQHLQKVGYDIVVFNGNVLGHAQGRIQEFEKGGAQHTVFFSDRRQPRAQVPKKLISGGGGGGGDSDTFFFGAPSTSGGGGVATGV